MLGPYLIITAGWAIYLPGAITQNIPVMLAALACFIAGPTLAVWTLWRAAR